MVKEVVLEVSRNGRRPRYHRGARSGTTLLKPEQCNTDQAGGTVRELRRLPEYPKMPRPWSQLCRRCWRGPVLAAALTLQRELEADR